MSVASERTSTELIAEGHDRPRLRFCALDIIGRIGHHAQVKGLQGLATLGVVIVSLSGCDGDGSSGAIDSSTSSSSSVAPLASDEFCSAATNAANGSFNFLDEARVAALTQDPSLTDRQRRLVTTAVADAVQQISVGGSYANDLLVSAVNEVCGLHLTPVTMEPTE